MTPGSGAYARSILASGLTDVPGDRGEVIAEDWGICPLDSDTVLCLASDQYDGLTKAEALYAATGEPCRLVQYVHRAWATVGRVPE